MSNRPESCFNTLVRLDSIHNELPLASPDCTSSSAVAPSLILVVDDDRPIVDAIREYLAARGHKVLGATSDTEALELARHNSESLSLVIMDVDLGESLGPALVDELLTLQSKLRVIYLSGLANDEALYRSDSKLPLAMLAKPGSLPVLAQTVEKLMAITW
jgi:two-component system cell cycle sensor histidine kinase/response regulator CckA